MTTMIPLADQHRVTYFKRFKMEADLRALGPAPLLPDGYRWIAWQESLVDAHAEVMFCSFQGETDALIFPSLGDRNGSRILMQEIRKKPGFLAEATWILESPGGHCGCIQGLWERSGLGAIQNLAVTPAHRGRGLGSALLNQALHGFIRAGLVRAGLEVTAQNDCAVRLYQRFGFRRRKTLYKAVEILPNAIFPISNLQCPLSNI